MSGLTPAAVGWRVGVLVRRGGDAGAGGHAAPDPAPGAADNQASYRALLRSMLTLIASEPVLRQRMMIGALSFGCFSTLWTSLSFLLSAAPFHYDNAVIGLFGLAGVAGAGAATCAGRLADRGRLARTTTAAILIVLVMGDPGPRQDGGGRPDRGDRGARPRRSRGCTSPTRTRSTRWRRTRAAA